MVVDPFLSSHGVVENDNAQIEIAGSAWIEVVEQTDAALDLMRSRKSRETSAGRLDKLRDVARGAAAQNQDAGRNSKQILDAV